MTPTLRIIVTYRKIALWLPIHIKNEKVEINFNTIVSFFILIIVERFYLEFRTGEGSPSRTV